MIASVNAPPKESEIRRQKVKIPSKSKDDWSSSTFDMDKSIFQSLGSISSISTSTVDPQSGANNSGAHSEFVNHGALHFGLILWNQMRQRWIESKKLETSVQQLQKTTLDWSITYKSFLGSNKPLSRPIPLSCIVDFLVDTWEQGGLYD